jgi:hypothetical protein
MLVKIDLLFCPGYYIREGINVVVYAKSPVCVDTVLGTSSSVLFIKKKKAGPVASLI